MNIKDIKVGMKLRLVTQDGGYYSDYGWQVGDIILVRNETFSLKNLSRSEPGYYRIPGDSYKGEDRNKWSRYFEPFSQTMKELLE